jgi:hypothetical protein
MHHLAACDTEFRHSYCCRVSNECSLTARWHSCTLCAVQAYAELLCTVQSLDCQALALAYAAVGP